MITILNVFKSLKIKKNVSQSFANHPVVLGARRGMLQAGQIAKVDSAFCKKRGLLRRQRGGGVAFYVWEV